MADTAGDTPKPAEPPAPRQRRKLDFSANSRSAFGQMLGTLSKAKREDKLQSATEAAQKKQLLEKKLRARLAREQLVLRKEEEIKKERTQANRKEEELAMKEHRMRHRHRQLPNLAQYLTTADTFDEPDDEMDVNAALSAEQASTILSTLQPSGSPAPIFYLPGKLLASQERLLVRRKAQVLAAIRVEWQSWETEKDGLTDEVKRLRVAAEEHSNRPDPEADDGKEDAIKEDGISTPVAEKKEDDGMNEDTAEAIY